MKKPVLLLLVASCVFAASCARKGNVSGAGQRLLLITDVGGVNDQSFNQGAWKGLSQLGKDTGATVSYLESKSRADYAAHIKTAVDTKARLIWVIGNMMGGEIMQAGIDYPNRQFAIIDYAYSAAEVPNKNVTGTIFATEECSYLVGYIAGRMTITGIVGHINGMGTPAMENFAVGFYAGVWNALPDAEIPGEYSGSFSDPAKGMEIARRYYGAGADIIFAAAGGTGAGVIEAAKERNKWAIGVDIDQNYLAPKHILTSALKRVDNAVYDISAQALAGNPGGGTNIYNLKNDGVDYATTGDHIPAGIIREVEAIKADIIAGKIKVPATAGEINALYPGRYKLPPQ
ncbi:MAG: BMP family ABC transporter substrate-binding protein [Treponema sp.]|nr:BMP family ABC transporter substrate-binding protein [Treponema sp.]